MKVAICLDDWKWPLFKKRLKENKFKFKKKLGITSDSLTLIIDIEEKDFDKLQGVVRDMNNEARQSRLH